MMMMEWADFLRVFEDVTFAIFVAAFLYGSARFGWYCGRPLP